MVNIYHLIIYAKNVMKNAKHVQVQNLIIAKHVTRVIFLIKIQTNAFIVMKHALHVHHQAPINANRVQLATISPARHAKNANIHVQNVMVKELNNVLNVLMVFT